MGIYEQFYYKPTKTIEVLSDIPSDRVDIDALISGQPPFINCIESTRKEKRILIIHGFDLNLWQNSNIKLLRIRIHGLIKAGFTIKHFYHGKIQDFNPKNLEDDFNYFRFWDKTPVPELKTLAKICDTEIDALCLLDHKFMIKMLKGDDSDWQHLVGLKHISLYISPINMDGLNQLLQQSGDTLESLDLSKCFNLDGILSEDIKLPCLTELRMNSEDLDSFYCGGESNLRTKSLRRLITNSPNLRVLELPHSYPSTLPNIQKPEIITSLSIRISVDENEHTTAEQLLPKMQQLKKLKLEYITSAEAHALQSLSQLEELHLTTPEIKSKELGAILEKNKNVKVLEISYTHTLYEPITNSLCLSQLEVLKLKSVSINYGFLEKILAQTKKLKRLDLYDSMHDDDLNFAMNTQELVELSLQKSSITSKSLQKILNQATKLKTLTLVSCNFLDQPFTVDHPLSELETLNLSDSLLHIDALAALLRSGLTNIQLPKCDFYAFTLRLQSPNLKELSIASPIIHISDLGQLRAKHKKLQRFTLKGCDNIPYEMGSFEKNISPIDYICLTQCNLNINQVLDLLNKIPGKKRTLLSDIRLGYVNYATSIPNLRIEDLHFSTVNFETDTLVQLLENTNSVKKITLFNCKGDFALARKPVALQSLEELKLTRISIDEESLKDLVLQAPNLKILVVCECPLLNLQAVENLHVPIFTFTGSQKDRIVQLPKPIKAKNRLDADTQRDPNKILHVSRQFLGNPETPDPRDVRHVSYNQIQLDPNARGITEPFILNNSKDLQLEKIPGIDAARKTKPLFAAFKQAGKHHYFGRFPLLLDHDWQPLPSAFADEQLLQFYLSSDCKVDIERSKRDDFYYIRLRSDAPPQPNPVTMELLISRPPPRYLFDTLPDAIKQHAKFCRGFRDQALSTLKPTATSSEVLSEMQRTRNGSCRHRSVVFYFLMQNENPAIPVRIIKNGCHMYPEVYYYNTWIRCDLGGYATNLVINENGFPEEPHDFSTPSPKENLPEIFEYTFSQTAKRTAPADFFEKARNLTTLNLKDYTSFDSLLSGHNLSMLDTLNISHSHIIAADLHALLNSAYNLKTLNIHDCDIPENEFAQLNFSMLKKLESVNINRQCIPSPGELQRLLSTAPATVQAVTDYDCQDTTIAANNTIKVIEKPRRIPSRYFKAPAEKVINIESLITADWRTGLINTQDVDQLRLAQQQYCIAAGIPHYYIHGPDELTCSAAFIDKQGDYGFIKKGPGGPLYDFLNTHQQKSLILINYNQFEPRHIAQKNSILDVERKADGTPVPKQAKIVGMMDPELNTYEGADFTSRFAFKHHFNATPTKPKDTNQTNQTQCNIELCGGRNWESRLIGHWEFKGKQLYFKEGLLITAIKKGFSTINLNNAPENEPAFQRFLQDLYLHQGIFHKGRLYTPLTHNFSLQFSKTISFSDKNTLLQFTPKLNTSSHVLNQAVFSTFLGVYHCDDKTGFMQRKEGLIAQFQQKILPVYLTGTLSSYQWLDLFEQCRLHKTVLQITLAPGVELPNDLKPDTSAPELRISHATHTQFIRSKRLPLETDKNAIIIDISELKASDLLPVMSSKLNDTDLCFEFKNKPGFLNDALDQDQTVILKGNWSQELSEALHPLVLQRLQAAQVRGKLILLGKNLNDFRLLTPTLFEKPVKPKKNVVHLQAAYEERYDKVMSALEQHPFVLLSGATGVGKTHFIYHIWKKQHPACHIGEDQIEAWINDPSSGIKTLFIDEANITQRQWSEFSGLFNTPPTIFYKGKYHRLTKDHKVIFAANPLSYGGERQMPELFRKHACEVTFQPIPAQIILGNLNLPAHIAKPIADLVNYLSKLNPNDTLITPREIVMMACLTQSAMLAHPKHDPVLFAKHFAYQLSKSHVPTDHIPEFTKRFAPEQNIPTQSVPLKEFVINNSNREALDTLNQHLDLRQCRLQKTATIPLQGGLGGVVIEGEPGIGKSELVIQLLQARGLIENVDFFRIPASMSTEDKETRLQALFHAGKIAVIDEINSAPMMERVLNALLEGRDLEGNPADNAGFMLIGTQNPISFAGRRKTTLPLQHRLQTIKMPVYSKDEMLGIVKHLGVPSRIAKDLVAEYELKQKTDKNLCFRDLINAAKSWLELHKQAKALHIDLTALPQIGSLCKTVAIANVESYFAKQLQYTPMPLWSRKQNSTSIRKLVKNEGSVQGEILEYPRWEKSFQTLGYNTQTVDFTDNINSLVENVKKHLAAGNLPLIAFAVIRDVGQPDPDPSEPHEAEHAAVITGFNPMTDEFTLAHWGKSYTVDIVELFNANQALPETRTKEAYFRNPEYQSADKDHTRKYLLDKTGGIDNRKHSIVPTEHSGFRGKLLIVNQPEKSELLNKRNECLGNSHFFKRAHLTIDSQDSCRAKLLRSGHA